MIALVFGDEKRANPNPKRIKLIMMKKSFVELSRVKNSKSPIAAKTIPIEAIILGSIMSDNQPLNGEKIA